MASYKFLRILGGDPEGGYVIKIDRTTNEGMTFNSDHVYEISKFMTEQGPQVGVQRMDTLPFVGEKFKINPAVIIWETEVPENSPVIKFVEGCNAKAAEEKTGLILS
ncbi:MAG: hypothetical protein MJZ34_02460 [Paludibacteraceae bacterium]|nr:hypothetical protein [Paludibacteraceae bacterium]